MDDPADHSPVINPRRQQRRQPRKLPISKPELSNAHSNSPFPELESENRPAVNPDYGS